MISSSESRPKSTEVNTSKSTSALYFSRRWIEYPNRNPDDEDPINFVKIMITCAQSGSSCTESNTASPQMQREHNIIIKKMIIIANIALHTSSSRIAPLNETAREQISINRLQKTRINLMYAV